MRIGELAGMSGVAASTLRFYESNGLLPVPRRSSNGYRDYPQETLERIGLIRLAQSLGFNLEQIRKGLASQGTQASHDMLVSGLQERLVEIERLQATLAEQHDSIEEMLDKMLSQTAGNNCQHLSVLASPSALGVRKPVR